MEDSLRGFTGTILFVSHDRYFIKQLATGLLKFENGTAEYIDKTWDEYEENETARASMVMASEKEAEKKEVPKTDTRRQVSPEAKKRELRKLERDISSSLLLKVSVALKKWQRE